MQMGIYAIKPAFRRHLAGVERHVIRLQVGADTVTTAGLGCGLAAAACLLFARVNPLWLVAVAPLVLLRLVCNALDGMIAQHTHTARPLGQIYNEFCDRVGDAAILVAATVVSGAGVAGVAALTLVLLASYLGTAAAAAGGTRQYIGVMGKADRMVLLAIAAPVTLAVHSPAALSGFLIVVAVGALVTLVQRALAIHRELRGVAYR